MQWGSGNPLSMWNSLYLNITSDTKDRARVRLWNGVIYRLSLPKGGVQEVIPEGGQGSWGPLTSDEQDQGWYVGNNSHTCSLQPQKVDSGQVESTQAPAQPKEML